MTARERDRRIALMDLLAMPDQERVTRAHAITVEGHERRYELISELALIYIAHAQGAHEAEP